MHRIFTCTGKTVIYPKGIQLFDLIYTAKNTSNQNEKGSLDTVKNRSIIQRVRKTPYQLLIYRFYIRFEYVNIQIRRKRAKTCSLICTFSMLTCQYLLPHRLEAFPESRHLTPFIWPNFNVFFESP